MGCTPCSIRYLPAGESFLKLPAGEMWSVVTESPKIPSALAPLISPILPGCIEKFSKNGGSWMYVLLASQRYTLPTEEGISFHAGFCAAKSLYNVRKISGFNALFIASLTSWSDGHKSRK